MARDTECEPLLSPRGRGWPGARAGLLSRVSFGYLSPLFRVPRPLRPDDLFDLPDDLSAARNARDAFAAWDARDRGAAAPAGTLARALLASGAARPLLTAAPLKVLSDMLALVRPVIFERLVSWFAEPAVVRDPRVGAAWVALMFFVAILGDVLVRPQYMALAGHAGTRLDRTLALMLQRKALRVDAASRGSSGKIVSLFTIDSKSVDADACQSAHMVWAGPLQVLVGFLLLYRLLGFPALAGVLVMVLASAVASVQCNIMKTCMENRLEWSDKRLRLISEVLSVVRQVKTAGLESTFHQKISDLRKAQMDWTWKASVTEAFGWVLWDSLAVVVIAVTFGAVAIVSPELLIPEKVFAAMALLEVIHFPITYAPEVFQGVLQAYVSLGRIAEFLDQPETEGRYVDSDPAEYARCAAALRGGTFSWGSTSVLRNPRVEIPRGALTIVTGPVGAGKSSLVAALLGEMTWTADSADARRATFNANIVSYAPQEPFIFDGSVRENIVCFAEVVDESWYADVLKACALERDVAEMPQGDATILGSRGHQLSGGQKARVALARCVFLQADVYVLDSTLSALDTNVARHVYSNVIGSTGLLAGKTRIVISHIPVEADFHIKVVDGVVSVAKAPSEVVVESETMETREFRPSKHGNLIKREAQTVSDRVVDDELAEVSSSGVLGQSLRWYVFFSGLVLPLIACGLIIVSQLAVLGLDVYLSRWSTAIEGGSSDATSRLQLFVLLSLCAFAAVIQLIKQMATSFASLRVAEDMHERMLESLFRARTWFFDVTPVGTVMNRFAGDVSAVDFELPLYLTAAGTMTVLMVLICILTVGISPASCLVALPVALLYANLSARFCKVARDLQGLVSASGSPLLSCFEESLDASGIQVLRASCQTAKHLGKFSVALDVNTRAALLSTNLANRYLSVRVALYGACFTAGIGTACVASANWLSSGVVGLMLIWSFKLTGPLSWLPSLYGTVQTGLVGCERIRSFLVTLPRESPVSTKRDVTLEEDQWPVSGHVVVRNVQMRYRPELPLALKGISFDVPGGSSLGICGRTGAGKSSVMAALLRSTEIDGGSVEIDDVDTKTIGLRLLRRKVAVLPQDPMLFRASVRENLDPEKVCSDAEIWTAIKRAQVARCVDSLGGLDGFIEDAGQNLSPGERQLLALARILCRQGSSRSKASFKVLLLDEASASLDVETDKIIQGVIRTWLTGCTMIVIAHRIETIMSCDRVCVVDGGVIVEGPEAPVLLLSKESSRFSQLASGI